MGGIPVDAATHPSNRDPYLECMWNSENWTNGIPNSIVIFILILIQTPRLLRHQTEIVLLQWPVRGAAEPKLGYCQLQSWAGY
jgi:hypothetical protein